MLGFLLIDKPSGMTSHDVVAIVRKKLNLRRVGHSGTLDPLATGLLVLGVGPATRLFNYLELEPKEYHFSVHFGQTTDTYDTEGKVTGEADVPHDLEAKIRSCLDQFLGQIDQLPPQFSAIKLEGKPLYSYARKGIAVERAHRQVTIHALDLVSCDAPRASFTVLCSTGTYVRSIAHDLGNEIGCGAHVTSIRRTRAGRFRVENAVGLDADLKNRVIEPKHALANLETCKLTGQQTAFVQNGRTISVTQEAAGEKTVLLVDPDETLLGIGNQQGGVIHPVCMMPRTESVIENR